MPPHKRRGGVVRFSCIFFNDTGITQQSHATQYKYPISPYFFIDMKIYQVQDGCRAHTRRRLLNACKGGGRKNGAEFTALTNRDIYGGSSARAA